MLCSFEQPSLTSVIISGIDLRKWCCIVSCLLSTVYQGPRGEQGAAGLPEEKGLPGSLDLPTANGSCSDPGSDVSVAVWIIF